MAKALKEEKFSSSTKGKLDNAKHTVRYKRLSDGSLQYLKLSSSFWKIEEKFFDRADGEKV